MLDECAVWTWLVLCCACVMTSLAHYDPFMDQVYFSIAWPSASPSLPDSDALSDDNSIEITTEKNEKYRCLLPQVASDSQSDEETVYSGPSEMELLTPLFKQTSCSYRIEMYWTYELCHGKFLRQFHEDKEGREEKTRLQEYILGNYNTKKTSNKEPEEEEEEKEQGEDDMPQTKARTQKVSGLEIPFFPLEFTGGTPCDLTGVPRRTSVHYVCQPEGRGEIYEFKETSTCEYEMVVLTSLLCQHPAYGAMKETVNQIECRPLDGAPPQPASLQAIENELRPPAGAVWDEETLQEMFGPHLDWIKQHMNEDQTPTEESAPSQQRRPQPTPDTSHRFDRESRRGNTPQDKSLLENFLRGEYCLEGGSGWWKHEFCYGKHVKQYHQDKEHRTEILLGVWREDVHRKWMNEHENKRPRPDPQERRHVWQYYSGGDLCDLTGSPRSVEVKLKCKEGSAQTSAITLFLVEPSPCYYNLVVESVMLCDVVQRSDENGLLSTQ